MQDVPACASGEISQYLFFLFVDRDCATFLFAELKGTPSRQRQLSEAGPFIIFLLFFENKGHHVLIFQSRPLCAYILDCIVRTPLAKRRTIWFSHTGGGDQVLKVRVKVKRCSKSDRCEILCVLIDEMRKSGRGHAWLYTELRAL